MNILYISSKKKWGGVSSWMNETARNLNKRGHRVWIVAHPKGEFAQSADSNLSIVRKKLGMDYNPLTVLFLIYFIRKNGIDLVVTNIEKEVIIGGLAARFCRIPNIRRVGREDDFSDTLKVRAHHRLFADHSIVPCDYVRDRSISRAPFLRKNEFTTIYNGRNVSEFPETEIRKKRQEWGIPGNGVVIGVTSQLAGVKCIDGIIRAFSNLSKKHADIYLVIVGKGKERVALEKLSCELGLDRVVFAGFSNTPILCAAAFDIAVSNSNFEGFPNTVVEYFAAGTAAVVTDVGGVSEMARHMENAVLIPSGDDDCLENAIGRLIGSSDERLRLGTNAKKTIRDSFSEDIMIRSLEDTYSSIAAMKTLRK